MGVVYIKFGDLFPPIPTTASATASASATATTTTTTTTTKTTVWSVGAEGEEKNKNKQERQTLSLASSLSSSSSTWHARIPHLSCSSLASMAHIGGARLLGNATPLKKYRFRALGNTPAIPRSCGGSGHGIAARERPGMEKASILIKIL